MSVAFSFSAGDFIGGIQLVRDVITSLQARAGSSLEYRSLIYELFTLERALLEVKATKFDECQPAQLNALRCAATQCQHTIDRFLSGIQKYQPSLNAQGTKFKWRDALRKMQWAVCEKGAIEAFKAEIRGHAGSLELLLATAQMCVVYSHLRALLNFILGIWRSFIIARA